MIVTIKQNNVTIGIINVTIGIINVTDFFLRYHKSHNRYHKCHRSFFRSILKSLVNRQFQGGGLDKKKEDKIIKNLVLYKIYKNKQARGVFLELIYKKTGIIFLIGCLIFSCLLDKNFFFVSYSLFLFNLA